MIHNLARRIKKIEQKVGGDTFEIKNVIDMIVFQDKVRKGINVGNFKISPVIQELIDKAKKSNKR